MGLKDNWPRDVFFIIIGALIIWALAGGASRGEEVVAPASPPKVEWKQGEMTDREGNPIKLLYVEVRVSIQEACKKEGDDAWQEAVTKVAEAWVNEHAESEKLKGLDLKLGLPSLPCNIVGKDGILTFTIARPRTAEH